MQHGMGSILKAAEVARPAPKRRGRKPAMSYPHLRGLRYVVACRVLIYGETRAQVARDVGVRPQTIREWINQVLNDESNDWVDIRPWVPARRKRKNT